jgi:prevent-host-death family protein
MCYMAQDGSPLEVGVRALRQNLSVYLDRVREGAMFRVNERGHPVAMLVPLPDHATTIDRLVASGRAKPANCNLLALGRPLRHTRRSVSEALDEIRGDRL